MTNCARFGELPEALVGRIAQSDAARLTQLLRQAILIERLDDLSL
ncbi:MAG TPA: hypothetical protein VNL35_10160 [Chloroflexota bacterium]|nr:hypothetical protein [Chloroflexota bacterium]